MTWGPVRRARTATLDIGYEESGPADGPAVVLMHGFPDDVRAYDGVVGPLAAAGCRVIVPYLRGYGPTRFLAEDTPRSGQQAALGADLLGLLDALGIRRATLGGYDWGGRAACVVAALWPERVAGLVSVDGYNIQDIAGSGEPDAPSREMRLWYQWYFHTARGVTALDRDRAAFCRLLWRLWSPGLAFDDATFSRTAASFDNPDFVAVVIHSYRHRHRAAPGDPALEGIERRLAEQPAIAVPTIVLVGADDGVSPPCVEDTQRGRFGPDYARSILPGVGHFLPREAPAEMAAAVLSLVSGTP